MFLDYIFYLASAACCASNSSRAAIISSTIAFVRIVDLEHEMSVEFLKLKLLPISPHLRIVNNNNIKSIKTIGFCAGSGSEFIEDTPCDAFVTGDLKYHTAVETNKVVYDIGHFESEIFAVNFLKELAEVNDKGLIADEKSPFI